MKFISQDVLSTIYFNLILVLNLNGFVSAIHHVNLVILSGSTDAFHLNLELLFHELPCLKLLSRCKLLNQNFLNRLMIMKFMNNSFTCLEYLQKINNY